MNIALEVQSSEVILPLHIFPLEIVYFEDTQSWQSEFFIAPGLEAAQCQSLLQNWKNILEVFLSSLLFLSLGGGNN